MALTVAKTVRSLPTQGVPDDELLGFLRSQRDADEARWKHGNQSGTVYHGGDDHLAVLNETYQLFSVSNPLHTAVWPSVVKFEAEIVAMTANLLNGGDDGVVGTMTSGGTESIIMAAKTHRQWAEKEKGILEPEIICGDSKHAAIEKACDMLRIRLVELKVDPVTFQLNPEEVERHINSRTIMIYSSAPNYPQGIIDPIAELSDLALKHGVGLHVDCCLGGFVLPFAKRLRSGIPEFDFRLPGVTSMSCDTHKYGYAAKGTSVVLYRNSDLRNHQYFTFPEWTGGIYMTPTMPGSRAGALSAACWASMMRLGDAGFMDATAKILDATEALTAAARTTHGLFVLGEPKAMVVAIGSNAFNIYQLSDMMDSRGYSFSSCQRPPCIHLCVTLRHVEHMKDIIRVMRECTALIMENPTDPKFIGKGAALYGTTKGLAKDEVAQGLMGHMNAVLDVPRPSKL